MMFMNESAKGVFSSPNGQILQLVHLAPSSFVQLLQLRHVLFQNLEVSDIEIIVQVVCLLSFGNDRHASADLIVENYLRNCFGVF